jgi:hypothetical protein
MTNADGTLKRTNVVSVDSKAVTINGGSKPILLTSDTTVKKSFNTESSMRFSGMASNGKFAGTRDQNDGEKRMLTVDSDGNAGTSQFTQNEILETLDQVDENTGRIDQNSTDISKNRKTIKKNTKKINKLQDAASALGDAAEAAGAMGAALSGIPEMSLLPDEPVRCGIAGGGYGSQYAIAGGCAAKIKDSIHINTAIAYSPSVDYVYGSTSSFAGRVGISFPIGGSSSSKAKATDGQSDSASLINDPQLIAYRTEVDQTMSQLQQGLNSRDEDIQNLKARLEELLNNQDNKVNVDSEANNDLIALLQKRIDELEEEKRQSTLEDEKQNTQINELKAKLSQQETRFEALMKKLQSLLPGKSN